MLKITRDILKYTDEYMWFMINIQRYTDFAWAWGRICHVT